MFDEPEPGTEGVDRSASAFSSIAAARGHTPQLLPTPESGAATQSPGVTKLREARAMLEEGLIEEEDYDAIKRQVLSGLVEKQAATRPPF